MMSRSLRMPLCDDLKLRREEKRQKERRRVSYIHKFLVMFVLAGPCGAARSDARLGVRHAVVRTVTISKTQ